MNLDKYKAENQTHYLSCAHAIGRARKNYYMKCILLGTTANGKAKIVVFGDRNWANKEHVKRLKYVEPNRILALYHFTDPVKPETK